MNARDADRQGRLPLPETASRQVRLPLAEPEPLTGDAELSQDRRYRYTLWRATGRPLPTRLLCIGINPSDADEHKDDPTVNLLRKLARRLGVGRLVLCNLYALRSSDPHALSKTSDPIGPDNDLHIAEQAGLATITLVMWGQSLPGAAGQARAEHVARILKAAGHPLYCLAVTKHGHPHHPLRLKLPDSLIPWPGYLPPPSPPKGSYYGVITAKPGELLSSGATRKVTKRYATLDEAHRVAEVLAREENADGFLIKPSARGAHVLGSAPCLPPK